MRLRHTAAEAWVLRPLAMGLHRVHRAALRRPGRVVVCTVVVLLAVLPAVPRMRVALSIRDAIDPGSPASAELARSEASFGSRTSFLLLLRSVRAEGGFDATQSRAIEGWLDACRQRSDVASVLSPLDLRRIVDEGDSTRVVARIAGLDSLSALRGSPWQGILTDPSCRDMVAEIALAPSPKPTRFGRFDATTCDRIVDDARRRLRPHGIDVQAAGVGAFEAAAVRGIRRFRVLNLAVVALLVLLSRIALGTWRSGLLLLVPVVTASAAVYGGMALRGDPIDMLSTGLFLLLAVTAIEDFFFLSHLRMQSGRRWRTPFRRLLLPGMLTSLTTVLGFGSLVLSDLEIVRRLGLWAATGALLEWAATFVVLPAILAVLPAARSWTSASSSWRLASLERFAGARLPRTVGVGLLAVLIVAPLAAKSLDFSDSPERTFGKANPYSQATEQLRKSRDWTGQFWIVAAPREDDPVDDYEAEWVALDELLRLLRGWPGVTAILDPESALADLTGDRTERLERLQDAGSELDVASLAAPDGALRAQVFVRDVDIASVAELRDFTRGFGSTRGLYPAGHLIAYSEFAQLVPRALLRSLLACLVLVGCVVGFVAHARRVPVAPVLAASAWGPAFVLCVLALLSVPITFLTCVFAGVLVGLTGDNALQYVFARPGGSIDAGAATRGPVSIQVAVVMALCSLVFVGSAFVASRRLGLVLGLGLLASLVGDLWVLRAILPKRNRS